MKTVTIALAAVGVLVLAGCGSPAALPAPTTDNTRSWDDLATTTTTRLPAATPVADVPAVYTGSGQLYAYCDRGNLVYVFNAPEKAGIDVVPDAPQCAGATP